MRNEEEIKEIMKHYEDSLKEMTQCYRNNKDEDLNWLYIREIGLIEGTIKGLKIALGNKEKWELKDNKATNL